MSNLKRLVEAVLFASARKMEVAELVKVTKHSEAEVLAALDDLQTELDDKGSPTMLVEENGSWKLTVREQYIPVVKKVVTKTELPKSVLETLSIVAYKTPILQSKVIKLRTNKAYDHLAFLEQIGFITREKSGRTKLIKLTQKFYDYFAIDPTKLHDKFKKVGDLEKAIEKKEKEHEELEESQRKEAEEKTGEPSVVLGKTYDAVEPLEELQPTGVEPYTKKVGELEVYGEAEPKTWEEEKKERKAEQKAKKEKRAKQEKEAKEAEQAEKNDSADGTDESQEEKTKEPEETKPLKKSFEEKLAEEVKTTSEKAKPREFSTKGLYPEGIPKEMEEKVDARVAELLGKPTEKKAEHDENSKNGADDALNQKESKEKTEQKTEQEPSKK